MVISTNRAGNELLGPGPQVVEDRLCIRCPSVVRSENSMPRS